MVIGGRHLKLTGLALIGWFLAEIVLIYAAARSVGLLLTIAILAGKGLLGVVLFGASLRSVFGALASGDARRGLSGLAAGGFSAAGAALILLPGFLSTLAGLALFSPTVQAAILRWLNRAGGPPADSGIVTLDPAEWSEIRRAPPGVEPPPRRSIAP